MEKLKRNCGRKIRKILKKPWKLLKNFRRILCKYRVKFKQIFRTIFENLTIEIFY